MTNREKFQEAMQKEVDAIKEWSAEKFVDQMKSTGFHWSNIFQGFLWGNEWLVMLKEIDGEKLIAWLNEQAKGEMGQAMTNSEKFHDLMQKDVDTFKEWSDERLVGYVQHPAFHWHNPFQDFFYDNGRRERIEEIDKEKLIAWLNARAKEDKRTMTNRDRFFEVLHKSVDSLKEFSDDKLIWVIKHSGFGLRNNFQECLFTSGVREDVEKISDARLVKWLNEPFHFSWKTR